MAEESSAVDVVVDGVTVRGVITGRAVNCIAVTMTHPYQGLSTSRHIMAQALVRRNFLGENGTLAAQGLLRELYELARKVEARAPRLRENLVDYDARVAPLEEELHAIPARRSELKAAFKAGQLDQTQHQEQRAALSARALDLELQRHQLQDRLLFSLVSDVVPLDDRDNVLRFVRSICK
jgi:chromosome segregation ATPase